MDGPGPPTTADADLALCVTVQKDLEEVVGAILMDHLGPFSTETNAATSTLVFFPGEDGAWSDDEISALLGPDLKRASAACIERRTVRRDWVDGWREHFHPVVIGAVRVRPPWAPALTDIRGRWLVRGGRRRMGSRKGNPLVEVLINPGSGFGIGTHPTTQGTLRLLQEGARREERIQTGRGRLMDVGTGSGILAIAAAKMGWEPVVAFDVDPAAVTAARHNVAANRVAHLVQVWEAGAEDAPTEWFEGTTVLANMTLEPVLRLLRRLVPGTVSPARGGSGSAGRNGYPRRLVVSGILAGIQEKELLSQAGECGFAPGGRLEEEGWISMELFPERV